MKVYCIKDFNRNLLHYDNPFLEETIFHKNKIYDYHIRSYLNGKTIIVFYSKQSGVSMVERLFNEHFVSLKEMRKLKLENIK